MNIAVQTFCCKKVHESGNITWIVRWKDHKTGRWLSMVGGKTKTEAKLVEARAREALFRGEDPRPTQPEKPQPEPTVSGLIDRFYQDPRFLNSSEGWQEVRRGQLENVIRPELGGRPFSSLKKDQLFRLYMTLKDTK